jgi:hypothetical protein
MNSTYPLTDLALSRRLERTEAFGCADFVETRARLQPESRAGWLEVAGAYAMFDGVESPITQTFGLGVFEPVTPTALDEIEAFYRSHHAPTFHEISPLADQTLLTLLHQRGYHPIELTSVMFRPLGLPVTEPPRNPAVTVRQISANETQLWAETAAAGWSESTEFASLIFELAQIIAARQGGGAFLGELDGQAIATGSLVMHEGIALLAGASTIPSARQQGAQAALLRHRLQVAVAQGCDLAMMCAAPGSPSQRNAERQGFRIAYTRIKWALAGSGSYRSDRTDMSDGKLDGDVL